MLVGTGLVSWTRPELSVFCLLTIILSPALGSVQASYPQNTDCVSGKGKGCLGNVMPSQFNMLHENQSMLTLYPCCRYCPFVEDGDSSMASVGLRDAGSVGMLK